MDISPFIFLINRNGQEIYYKEKMQSHYDRVNENRCIVMIPNRS